MHLRPLRRSSRRRNLQWTRGHFLPLLSRPPLRVKFPSRNRRRKSQLPRVLRHTVPREPGRKSKSSLLPVWQRVPRWNPLWRRSSKLPRQHLRQKRFRSLAGAQSPQRPRASRRIAARSRCVPCSANCTRSAQLLRPALYRPALLRPAFRRRCPRQLSIFRLSREAPRRAPARNYFRCS